MCNNIIQLYTHTCCSQALCIQILLRMNRIDLALQKLKEMKTAAEDHVLAKLATSWIIIIEGDNNKIQESVYNYEELIDKYSKYSIFYCIYVNMYKCFK